MEDEVYAKMYQREDYFWWHRGMRRIVAAILEKYLLKKSGNKILDVGCGTGGMFRTLAKYGEVDGIDKSALAIEKALARGLASSVSEGSIDCLPYADASFDVVTCFDVLYHRWVTDDLAALGEIKRVLKPHGLLVIREASYDWLRSQHDELVWTKHRFSRPELKEKILQSGFTVLKCSYLNFFLFLPAMIKRLSETLIKEKNPLSNMFISHTVVNKLFAACLYLESVFIRLINFPFGLSVICVAKKK